jgi:hypothetical protein
MHQPFLLIVLCPLHTAIKCIPQLLLKTMLLLLLLLLLQAVTAARKQLELRLAVLTSAMQLLCPKCCQRHL